jgi:protein gp37
MDAFLTFFTSLPTDQIALGALVTVMVISILRGWVVPRSVLVDRMADKDARIAALEKERDAWHTAHDTSEAGRQELKKQNGELIRSAEIANRFMETARAWFDRDSHRSIEGER